MQCLEKTNYNTNINYNKKNHHLIVRFHKDLVVFAQGNQEHDGRDVLKAVDPLPALWSLPSDIHHPETEVTKYEYT